MKVQNHFIKPARMGQSSMVGSSLWIKRNQMVDLEGKDIGYLLLTALLRCLVVVNCEVCQTLTSATSAANKSWVGVGKWV